MDPLWITRTWYYIMSAVKLCVGRARVACGALDNSIKYHMKSAYAQQHEQYSQQPTRHTTRPLTSLQQSLQVTRTAGVLTHASIMTPRTLHYYTAA